MQQANLKVLTDEEVAQARRQAKKKVRKQRLIFAGKCAAMALCFAAIFGAGFGSGIVYEHTHTVIEESGGADKVKHTGKIELNGLSNVDKLLNTENGGENSG